MLVEFILAHLNYKFTIPTPLTTTKIKTICFLHHISHTSFKLYVNTIFFHQEIKYKYLKVAVGTVALPNTKKH